MRKILILCMAVVSISGCGLGQDKEISVCTDIVRGVAVDPESVKINSSRVVRERLSPERYRSEYKQYTGESEIGQDLSNLIDMYERDGGEFSLVLADLDVTYEGTQGKSRSQAICSYLTREETVSLMAFELGGQSVKRDQFIDFFMLRKKPDGLSLLYDLK